jgi:hypothetical protein
MESIKEVLEDVAKEVLEETVQTVQTTQTVQTPEETPEETVEISLPADELNKLLSLISENPEEAAKNIEELLSRKTQRVEI